MTAATSSKRPNYFGRRYMYGISENKKLLIVNSLLSLLGLPFVAVLVITIRHIYETGANDLIINKDIGRVLPLFYIAGGFAVAAMLLGIVAALFSFSYLYKKTSVDMNYSLPLSNRQRFFADFLSGLTIYAVPNVISIGLTIVIFEIGKTIVDQLFIYNDLKLNCQVGIIMIMAMLLYYTICVFAISFCGSLFEAIFSTVAYTLLVPATVVCVWFAAIYHGSLGLSVDNIFISPIFTASNPIGTIAFFAFFSDYSDTNEIASIMGLILFKWVLMVLFFIAVHIAGAYFHYARRKAELVSKPYVYNGFFYLLLSASMFCIIVMFGKAFGNIVPGIILSAVIWLIMEIINRRGFRKFWTAFLSFGISLGAVILITNVLLKPVGRLAVNKVPNPSSVSAVTISIPQMTHSADLCYFTEKDVIEETIALNKKLLEINEDPDAYFSEAIGDVYVYDENYLTITYFTKSGNMIVRDYSSIPSAWEADMIKAIMLSDTYIDKCAAGLADIFNSTYTYDDQPSAKPETKCFSITDKLNCSFGVMDLTENEVLELSNAYKHDLKNMTGDDIENIDDVKYFIENSYPVYSCCGETIAFLESHCSKLPSFNIAFFLDRGAEIGISVEPAVIADTLEFRRDDPEYFSQNMEVFNSAFFSKYGHCRRVPDAKITCLGLSDSLNGCSPTHIVSLDPSGNNEILRNLTPIVFNKKILAIYDHNFFLIDTPENRALIEKYAVPYTDTDYDEEYGEIPVTAAYR